MENGTNGWDANKGKKIRLVYKDDTSNTRVRDGVLRAVQDGMLFLMQSSPFNSEIIIPIAAVIRIEVVA